MILKINSKEENIDKESLTISELLKLKGVEMPDMVSVQLNGEFIEKSDYDSIKVKDNDEIEFLYFMGGGSYIL